MPADPLMASSIFTFSLGGDLRDSNEENIIMVYTVMAYVVMAFIVMAYIVMACAGMAYKVMARTIVVCISMA